MYARDADELQEAADAQRKLDELGVLVKFRQRRGQGKAVDRHD